MSADELRSGRPGIDAMSQHVQPPALPAWQRADYEFELEQLARRMDFLRRQLGKGQPPSCRDCGRRLELRAPRLARSLQLVGEDATPN